MKISRTMGCVVTGLLMTACDAGKPVNQRALEHSAKYLNGIEYVVAKDNASKIFKKDYVDASKDIFYWDSIVSVNKEKEAFQKGIKYIKDSLAGIYKRKPLFNMPLKPDVSKSAREILAESKKEASKYYSGQEMLTLEKKAPNADWYIKHGTSDNYTVHYLGQLTIVGAERKGYNEGLQFARDSLKKELSTQISDK